MTDQERIQLKMQILSMVLPMFESMKATTAVEYAKELYEFVTATAALPSSF